MHGRLEANKAPPRAILKPPIMPLLGRRYGVLLSRFGCVRVRYINRYQLVTDEALSFDSSAS